MGERKEITMDNQDELYNHIKNIIYKWVAKNFGTQEAEDPSWSIEALAEEIYFHRWEIYEAVREDCTIEDIERIAEDKGVKLTKDQVNLALHRYSKTDDYNLEQLDYIVDEVVGK